jgi:hypothetical protein
MSRLAIAALFSASAAAFSSTVAQSSTAAATPPTPPAPATYVRPAAPGQLVDVGGRRLHLDCKGVAAVRR